MGQEVRRLTVYADTLFLLNGLVDYLLLLLAGRVTGIALRRGRIFLAACLGGGYAVACFLPVGEWLSLAPVKLAAGVGLVIVAFGGSGRILSCGGVFFALSCGLAGGIFALSQLNGGLSLERGVVITPLDLKAVLLAAAICWAVVELFFRGFARHSRLKGETIPLTISYRGRSVTVTALVDTGNGLTDPLNGKPVVVLEWQEAVTLLPELNEDLVRHPAERLADAPSSVAWRLLPYHSVGAERGLLLAFAPDRITSDGQERPEGLVALTAQRLSQGGSCGLVAGRK
jgi:stage II sporulation protein GA (sporulation sigma-E factor processing peptidase)